MYVGSTSGPLHRPNGAGKLFYPDGRPRSDGLFVDGLMQGAGVHHFEDGAVYTGNFVNGWGEGIGRIVYPSGSSYEGEWKQGNQHGIGRFSWPNGRVYEGQWANGQRAGLGVLWSKGGKVLKCGLWRDDKFAESRPVPRRLLPADSKHLTASMRSAGASILLLPTGGYYSGPLNAADQRHGEGVIHSADGQVTQRGVWWEDELICPLPKEMAGAPIAAADATSGAAAGASGGRHAHTSASSSSASAAASAALASAPAARYFEAPSTDCVVCVDRPRDCLIDCVHFCLCCDCAASLQQCPICRAAITHRIRKRIVMS